MENESDISKNNAQSHSSDISHDPEITMQTATGLESSEQLFVETQKLRLNCKKLHLKLPDYDMLEPIIK